MSLICNVLEIDVKELQNTNEITQKKTIIGFIINLVFYILLNLLLMFIIGYLTLFSEANLNSRIGALLLSFFIPFYIVYLTSLMNPTERVLKFGFGYFAYIIMLLSIQGLIPGFQSGIRTGLFLCLIISIGVLFYGNFFLKSEK